MSENQSTAYRRLIVDAIKNFEAALGEDQEAKFTVHLGGRDISMFLCGIASNSSDLLLLLGRDQDDRPIDVAVNYSMLSYSVEAVEKRNPQRFGFRDDRRIEP